MKGFGAYLAGVEPAVRRGLDELNRRLKLLEDAPSGGGVTDHGALTGLGDNDHPQYSLTTHGHTSANVTDFVEAAQDAVGAMVGASLVYVDATPSLQRAALTGDVTAAAGSNATLIANDAVTNAKLANMANATLKGRATAGAGDPEDLTAAQVKSILAVAASEVTNTPAGSIAATTVQAALNELDSEKAALAHTHTASQVTDFNAAADARVSIHVGFASNAHAASAISNTPAGGISAANVQAALNELDSEKAAAVHTHTAANVTDLVEAAQDAVGAMVDASLVYVDGTPLLTRAALTGDVTAAQGSNATTIANDVVSNSKLANMPATSIKGNNTASTGDPLDLTAAQATAMLDLFTSAARGLAPASGGGTTNFLRADGTWAAPPSGGGGVTDGDKGDVTVSAGGTVWTVDSTGPGAWGATLTERLQLLETPQFEWRQTTATAGLWTGTAGAGAGTFASTLPTAGTDWYRAQKRARYANVVTTLNQVLGQRNTEAIFHRGSVAGTGGFLFRARFGLDIWTNGGRLFVGLTPSTTAVSADPSLANNSVGFCIDAADAGAISFLTRGTASTKAPTGLTAASNKGYEVVFYCPPNGTAVAWKITDRNTGTSASGSATANLPANTTFLTANVLASNAALTAVNAVQLGVISIAVAIP